VIVIYAVIVVYAQSRRIPGLSARRLRPIDQLAAGSPSVMRPMVFHDPSTT
jgi:hypothetical protein